MTYRSLSTLGAELARTTSGALVRLARSRPDPIRMVPVLWTGERLDAVASAQVGTRTLLVDELLRQERALIHVQPWHRDDMVVGGALLPGAADARPALRIGQ